MKRATSGVGTCGRSSVRLRVAPPRAMSSSASARVKDSHEQTVALRNIASHGRIPQRHLFLWPLVLHIVVASSAHGAGNASPSIAPQRYSVQGVMHHEIHDPFEPSLSRSYSFEFVLDEARWEALVKPITWSGRRTRMVEGRVFGEATPEFVQARFDGDNLYYLYAISTNFPGFASLLNAANALWTRRPAPIGTDDLVMALWYTYGAQSYLATNRSGLAYPLTAGAGDSLLDVGVPVLVPVGIEPSNLPGSSYRSIITHSYVLDSSGVRVTEQGSTTNSILEISEFGQLGELSLAKSTRMRHYFKLGDRPPFLRSEISIRSTNSTIRGAVQQTAPRLPGMSWIRVHGHFGNELGLLNFSVLTNSWPPLLDVKAAQSAYQATQDARASDSGRASHLYKVMFILILAGPVLFLVLARIHSRRCTGKTSRQGR